MKKFLIFAPFIPIEVLGISAIKHTIKRLVILCVFYYYFFNSNMKRSGNFNGNDKRAHGLAVYRLLGMQEVEGSIPSGSIYPLLFLANLT